MRVESRSWDEKGADRGRGRGPWTVHVSLRAGALHVRDLLAAVGVDDSSSKYAEPEADGVKPVLRTGIQAGISTRHGQKYCSL